MRKRLLISSLSLGANAVLAGGLLAFGGGAGTDCCKVDSGGAPYCCDGCCWFVNDCDSDEECRNN